MARTSPAGGVAHAVGRAQLPDGIRARRLTGGRAASPDVTALSAGDAKYAALNADYVNGHAGASLLHAQRRHQRRLAAVGLAHHAVQRHLQGPGPAQARLLHRPALHRRRHRARARSTTSSSATTSTASTRRPSQTGYFNPQPRPVRWCRPASATPPAGLRPRERARLAQRPAAGARADAIAHQQVSFSTSPAMLDSDGPAAGCRRDQVAAVPDLSHDGDATVGMSLGNGTTSLASAATAPYAWTARLAQQSLQADFDPGLVLLFDKQGQGSVASPHRRAPAQSVGVSIDGSRRPRGAGHPQQSVRLRRLLRRRRRRARLARGLDRPDRGRRQQRARRGAHAPGRREQPAAHLLQGRRPERHDRRQGAGPRRLRRGGAGRAYQTTSGATGITGAGYGQFERGPAEGRQRRRHHRHAAGQPHHRRLLLGLRQRQREGRTASRPPT